MRVWAILLTSVWLAGCASAGTVDRDKLGQLAVGRTTDAELTTSWGPPLSGSTLPDGRRVMTYRYVWMQTGPTTSFVPGFGPIGSTTDTLTGQVTLTFDLHGVLQAYSYAR